MSFWQKLTPGEVFAFIIALVIFAIIGACIALSTVIPDQLWQAEGLIVTYLIGSTSKSSGAA